MRAAPYPSLELVYQRDRGQCWLCNRFVPKAHATRDHVAPVSRGGPTTMAGIRLAHKRCNGRRGNPIPNVNDILWDEVSELDAHINRRHLRRFLSWWQADGDVPQYVEDFLLGRTPLPSQA